MDQLGHHRGDSHRIVDVLAGHGKFSNMQFGTEQRCRPGQVLPLPARRNRAFVNDHIIDAKPIRVRMQHVQVPLD